MILAVIDSGMRKAIEIQKADPQARRRAAVVIAVGMAIAAFLVLVLKDYRSVLLEWLVSRPELWPVRIKIVAIVLAVLSVVPLYGISVYLWRFGGVVTEARRFPPPGSAVVRDTRILMGRDALRRGRTSRAMAVLLAVAATALAIALWWVAVAFEAFRA